jgi:hypothetical protein
LAYKKQAWINGKNPKKRHITQKIVRGHPDRAVDGKIDFDLHSCTILDNLYGDTPVWTVDLGTKTSVSGVIIYTWQGSGEQKVKGQSSYIKVSGHLLKATNLYSEDIFPNYKLLVSQTL